MKTNIFIKPKPTLLKGVLLLAMAASMAVQGATALTPRLIARPVTPGDVTTYALPSSTEVSGGLNTVGLGTPASRNSPAAAAMYSSPAVGSWGLVVVSKAGPIQAPHKF